MREFQLLKSPKAFLQSKLCIPANVKVISRVELWSISSRIFDIFGADTEASITKERVAELESLRGCFELCRSTLPGAIASKDDGPGDFFQQLFDLFIHCSKLSPFFRICLGALCRDVQGHRRQPLTEWRTSNAALLKAP